MNVDESIQCIKQRCLNVLCSHGIPRHEVIKHLTVLSIIWFLFFVFCLFLSPLLSLVLCVYVTLTNTHTLTHRYTCACVQAHACTHKNSCEFDGDMCFCSKAFLCEGCMKITNRLLTHTHTHTHTHTCMHAPKCIWIWWWYFFVSNLFLLFLEIFSRPPAYY